MCEECLTELIYGADTQEKLCAKRRDDNSLQCKIPAPNIKYWAVRSSHVQNPTLDRFHKLI